MQSPAVLTYHTQRLGYVFGVASALAYAFTTPTIKYLIDVYHVPELAIMFWRNAIIASVCIGGVLVIRPALLRVNKRDMKRFALVGSISVGLFHMLLVYSIKFNGAALAVVLLNLNPSFVALGAYIFLGEQITRRHMLSLVLAFVGCVLLVRAYDVAVLQTSWIGIVVGVGTGAALASYMLFNQRIMTRHNAWVSLALTMVFGALALLVVLVLVQGGHTLVAVGDEPKPWLILVFLALMPTLGGYGFLLASMQYVPARITSLLGLIELPTVTLVAWLVLGEQMEVVQVVGMVLIIGAAVLPGLERRRPARIGQ